MVVSTNKWHQYRLPDTIFLKSVGDDVLKGLGLRLRDLYQQIAGLRRSQEYGSSQKSRSPFLRGSSSSSILGPPSRGNFHMNHKD